jgi:D-glutamate cyclase
MTADEKLAAILAAVQTDPGNRGLARDPHDNLVTATKGDFEAACRSIAEHPKPYLGLVTGFYIPTATPPAGETDGPLGTVFLTRAFSEIAGQLLVTDFSSKPAIDVGLRIAGISADVATIPGAAHPWSVWLALDWEGRVKWHGMSHLISVERVGPSRKDGRCYSMRERDITDLNCPAHHLFDDTARFAPNVTQIGIGDGGNEIGMGRIPWATIARNIPNGDRIACRVPTDHLIVAGVSNWGAYALAAGVFVLKGITPPADLFDPDREREILEVMVREGPLVDGVTGQQTATVDGLTWDEYVKPLVRIRELLKS